MGGDAVVQRLIIAGPFPFHCALPRGEPYKWVQPVDGASDLGHEQRRVIPAFDVSELVQQHDVGPLRWPLRRGLREWHDRSPRTPRERSRHRIAGQDAYTPLDPRVEAETMSALTQLARGLVGFSCYPLDTQAAEPEATEQDQGAAKPDAQGHIDEGEPRRHLRFGGGADLR